MFVVLVEIRFQNMVTGFSVMMIASELGVVYIALTKMDIEQVERILLNVAVHIVGMKSLKLIIF